MSRISLLSLLFLTVLPCAPAAAQATAASSPGPKGSPAEDNPELAPAVSLDRIREALSRPPARSLLGNLKDLKADFRSEIEIRQKLDALLSTIDFKTGPAPAGGLYGYEQQQRLWNSVSHPLMQPYAAFSGGEMITLAIENLAAKYLGARVLSAVTGAQRARAEEAARAEVSRTIAEYCAVQPGHGAAIEICETAHAAQFMLREHQR